MRSCCSRFLRQAGYEGCTNEGAGYSLRKEEYGGHLPRILIPTPISQGEEGFLFLLNLDQKCHGIGSSWVLLIQKVIFIVMRA